MLDAIDAIKNELKRGPVADPGNLASEKIRRGLKSDSKTAQYLSEIIENASVSELFEYSERLSGSFGDKVARMIAERIARRAKEIGWALQILLITSMVFGQEKRSREKLQAMLRALKRGPTARRSTQFALQKAITLYAEHLKSQRRSYILVAFDLGWRSILDVPIETVRANHASIRAGAERPTGHQAVNSSQAGNAEPLEDQSVKESIATEYGSSGDRGAVVKWTASAVAACVKDLRQQFDGKLTFDVYWLAGELSVNKRWFIAFEHPVAVSRSMNITLMEVATRESGLQVVLHNNVNRQAYVNFPFPRASANVEIEVFDRQIAVFILVATFSSTKPLTKIPLDGSLLRIQEEFGLGLTLTSAYEFSEVPAVSVLNRHSSVGRMMRNRGVSTHAHEVRGHFRRVNGVDYPVRAFRRGEF